MSLVWSAWVSPESITQWNHASDDWCCPEAKIHFEEGGRFRYRMEAKDGSAGFDFEGQFRSIQHHRLIAFALEDGRNVRVEFITVGSDTRIVETFEAEEQNAAELQRQGWLCILENFKRHVESIVADSGAA